MLRRKSKHLSSPAGSPSRPLRRLSRGPRSRWGLVAGLGLLMLVSPARADDDAGIPGDFLRFGTSARMLGMGSAAVGLADDVSLAYVNPAGLAQLRTMELSAMGARLFEDTNYMFFSLGLPTDYGSFAFSGTFVSSGSFERATIFEDLDDTFSETEGSFALSYARGSGRLSWGATLKSVSQNVAGASGGGLGADLGVYFRPHRSISFGLAWQNVLAPEITLDEAPEEFARSIRLGTALRFFNNRLLVAADLINTQYMQTSFRSGIEVWATRSFGLRTGYDAVREELGVGAGFRLDNWQFDYTYLNHELGGTNIVSATLRFGVPYGVKVQRDKELFSPSGTDKDVTFDIETAITGKVESWQMEILDDKGDVVRVMEGNGTPPEGISWAGEDDNGRLVADGTYHARMQILDDLGQEWEYGTSVDVLGFHDRTKVPIRIEVSGDSEATDEGKKR